MDEFRLWRSVGGSGDCSVLGPSSSFFGAAHGPTFLPKVKYTNYTVYYGFPITIVGVNS